MAVRIQTRRDTAANWISANPVLRAGEIGIETDTLKMKVGNGSSTWNQITSYMNVVPSDLNTTLVDYVQLTDIGAENGVAGLNANQDLLIPNDSIIFEGITADSYELTLQATDPTADRTITLPDVSGTIVTTGDTASVTNTMLANSAITINGTSTSLGGTRTLYTDDITEDGSPTNLWFTDERAQDAVATAIAAGTHTNITITYDDNTNSLSFTGAQTYSDENAQDAVGNAVGNGLDYDDNTGAISVDPSEFALSAVGAPTGDISLANYKITNLATPTSANDAANKAYVDNTTAGLNFHAAVHAATTANLDATYNNGTSGVGATLTANANGALVVDGHTLSADERVLVKNQTTGFQNGIYVVTATGDGSNPYVLTRAVDADNNPTGEIAYGDFTFVQSGTVNAGYGYIVNTTGTITVGTTSISYVQFNAGQTVIAGNGLTESSPGTFAIDTTITANISGIQTLTNKTINLTDNTVSGTISQFNTALSDADFATLAGSETLTNKSISLTNNTLSGTTAEFNTALSDDNFATLTGIETLTNKSISGSSNTLSNIPNSALTNSSVTINGSAVSLGGSLTIPAASPTVAGTLFGKTDSASPNNTIVGYQAGNSVNNINNVLLGYQAGQNISTANSASNAHVIIGYQAGSASLSGTSEIFIGYRAGTSATTGNQNIVIGNNTGINMTTGGNNIFLGTQSANGVITGSYNTGIGVNTLNSLTSGGTNVAIGFQSLRDLTTASNNVALGTYSGQSINGDGNTAIGYGAIGSVSSGTYNTAIGYNAGRSGTNNLTTGTNNILIGYNAAASSATVSNEITLGNASITAFRIPGLSISASTTALTAPSFIKSGGTSSQFLKADGSVDSSTYLTTSTASSTYATLISPALTGTPTAPTAAADTNTVQIATTAFVIGQGYLKSTDASSTYLPLTGGTISSNLTITGDLTVNGTTTTVNSTTITVDDKNIELGSVASPTDSTADGGGITLKGATDKTLNWLDATDSWTSSENLDLASGKTFKINGTDVLTSTQVLGKSVPTGTIVGTSDSQTLTNKTLSTTSTSTVSTNTATTVDTTALSGFTTMKFVVSLKQGSKIRSSELIVQTDGTNVDYTEYGVVETGGTMNAVSVAASVSSTNCITTVYVANAATTNVTVKLVKILM